MFPKERHLLCFAYNNPVTVNITSTLWVRDGYSSFFYEIIHSFYILTHR